MSVGLRSDPAGGKAYLQVDGVDVASFDAAGIAMLGDGVLSPVVERGSNSDGEYVRYADGTQICWTRHEFTPSTSTYSLASAASWPAAFVAAPEVSLAGIEQAAGNIPNGSANRYIYRDAINATAFRIMLYSNDGLNLSNASAAITSVQAVGRWY